MMYLRNLKVFVLCCLGLMISSCISDIEFDVPPNVQNAFAVQGKVVKGNPSIIKVDVQQAVDFTGLSPSIRVKSVVLENVSAGQTLDIPSAGSNTHFLEIVDGDPKMSINYEDNYILTVETFAGDVIVSDPEHLLPVPKGSQISYSMVEVEELNPIGTPTLRTKLQFDVTTPTRSVSNELTRMRWAFEHTYAITDIPIRGNVEPKVCYITENLGALVEVTHDPNILQEEMVSKELIKQNITASYAEGNYFSVIQHSLTESAFKYFNQVSELLQREGSIFDAPAGKITTNFKFDNEESEKQVFGYFYMTELDTSRVFLDPEALGNPDRRCPVPATAPRACAAAVCCDCLDTEKSTVTKPEWW